MSEIISERIPLEVEGTPVCDIMIKKPYTCTENCTISDVVRIMAEHGVSSLPVVDSNYQVVGSYLTAILWVLLRSIVLILSSLAERHRCCILMIRALSSAWMG